MKKILITLVAFSIISCHSSKPSSSKTIIEKDNTPVLNGNWQLQMLFASDNNWVNAPALILNLKEKNFTGTSVCNSISGSFTLNENFLSFNKNIISTKKACSEAKMNQEEKAFLAALLKVNKYTITNNELELGQGEIVLMKFKRN